VRVAVENAKLCIGRLSFKERRQLLDLLQEKEKVGQRKRFYGLYPDKGPYRRELYRKHLEFFGQGKVHRERLFCAANRVGKTEGAGGFELTCHLTGEYPRWWPGRVFKRPVSTWAAGDTGKTTRDILQRKLLGPINAIGTGIIPGRLIERVTPKSGVADALELVYVKHVPTGRLSLLSLKSYDQKRIGFQGTEQDVILLDEEPPEDVYDECVLRTTATPERPEGGIVMLTYTPIQGLTPLTLRFLPEFAPAGDEELEQEETFDDEDDA
jgi:phage terminase large subunit-like protein